MLLLEVCVDDICIVSLYYTASLYWVPVQFDDVYILPDQIQVCKSNTHSILATQCAVSLSNTLRMIAIVLC